MEKHTLVHPTAFMSYSWDDDKHKIWVARLATRLRGDGVDVALDQWRVAPGESFGAYMEQGLSTCDFVLIVCTPKYKAKADHREGGVGYETGIMASDPDRTVGNGKYIPILRAGDRRTAVPIWLRALFYVDLRGEAYSLAEYKSLLSALHRAREQEPPLGKMPMQLALRVAKQKATAVEWLLTEDEAIPVDEDIQSTSGRLPEARHLRGVRSAGGGGWPRRDAA